MDFHAYRTILDPHLPVADFGRDRGVLGHLAAHLALIGAAGALAATHAQSWPLWALAGLALVAGHSVGLAAFCAHELGHGAVLGPGPAREALTQAGWVFALFTGRTIQKRAHNAVHHAHANTPRDPDRRPTLEEIAADPAAGSLAAAVFPNARLPWWRGLLGFHLSIFGYHTGLLVSSLRQDGTRFDMRLTPRERRAAILEFAGSALSYLGLLALAGFAWQMAFYLWLMYAVATTLDGLYIATNHMLSPYGEAADPVAQTVSLRVPRWLDWVHLGFSHHTEHHLYPTAGAKHYPAIRQALLTHFPERYRLMSWPEALSALFRSPLAIAGPDTLAHADGSGLASVTHPWPPAAAEPLRTA